MLQMEHKLSGHTAQAKAEVAAHLQKETEFYKIRQIILKRKARKDFYAGV
jgi:hypothetical protein